MIRRHRIARLIRTNRCVVAHPLRSVAVSRFFSTQSNARNASSGASGGGESGSTTHFGFQTVDSTQKAKLVADVFHKVASNYDVMNDFMSGGVHRIWKEQFVSRLGPAPGIRALDVAGGTGDVAFRIIETLKHRYPAPALSAAGGVRPSTVTVCDINASMLGVGRDRAVARGYTIANDSDSATASNATATNTAASAAAASAPITLRFVLGDAERLPFAANSFDAYTIAFGLRNVTHTELALADAYRVLDRGGRFMCLEFSRVDNPILSTVYDAYSFNVIPALGKAVTGDGQPYQYLVESIRKFHTQPELARLMRKVGFQHVAYENFLGGVACIHSGFKL